jgi:predicted  nucleic acid-binding Zn-ribbon protein
MEKSMRLEKLNGFEFECEKCGCIVKTDAGRETMLSHCPNCHHEFYFDTYNDPIALLKKAAEKMEAVKGVKVRLVCMEEETI